jgi:hypothetical protein
MASRPVTLEIHWVRKESKDEKAHRTAAADGLKKKQSTQSTQATLPALLGGLEHKIFTHSKVWQKEALQSMAVL